MKKKLFTKVCSIVLIISMVVTGINANYELRAEEQNKNDAVKQITVTEEQKEEALREDEKVKEVRIKGVSRKIFRFYKYK